MSNTIMIHTRGRQDTRPFTGDTGRGTTNADPYTVTELSLGDTTLIMFANIDNGDASAVADALQNAATDARMVVDAYQRRKAIETRIETEYAVDPDEETRPTECVVCGHTAAPELLETGIRLCSQCARDEAKVNL